MRRLVGQSSTMVDDGLPEVRTPCTTPSQCNAADFMGRFKLSTKKLESLNLILFLFFFFFLFVEAPLIIILFWYFSSKYLARAFRRLSSDFAAVVVVALLPLPLWFRVADLISGFRLVTDIFFFFRISFLFD